MPAAEVYALGERQMNSLMAEMRTVAERSFKTTDVPALLKALRTERRYLFRNRADLIAYTKAAVERAKAAAPGWFGRLPGADVAIEPYLLTARKTAPINTIRRQKMAAVQASSTSVRTRQRNRVGPLPNPRLFTKPFPAITCSRRSRSSAATHIQSVDTYQQRLRGGVGPVR